MVTKLPPLSPLPTHLKDAQPPASHNPPAPASSSAAQAAIKESLENRALILKRQVLKTLSFSPAASTSDKKIEGLTKLSLLMSKTPLQPSAYSSPSSRALPPLPTGAAAASASPAIGLRPLPPPMPKTPNTARTPIKPQTGAAAPVLFVLPATKSSGADPSKQPQPPRSLLFGANSAPPAAASSIFGSILQQPTAPSSTTPQVTASSPDDFKFDALNLR